MESMTTTDNGEIDVHIAPIGEFKGSNSLGNPVPEKITKESLENLAEKLNKGDEILADIDHQSCKPGVERDTRAAGWFYKFVVDPVKGLFAKLKPTNKGKELIQSREYRYFSPTFILDENGSPTDLHSVSLTNLPAFKGHIKPILNSEPNIKESIEMEITKDDLIQLIKDTVASMNEAPAEDKAEMKEVEEVKEEKASDDTTDTTDTTDTREVEEKKEVVNACGKAKVVKNEEVKEEPAPAEAPKASEDKEIAVDKDEAKKEKEVIKIQALNSAPTVGIGDPVTDSCGWERKHGKAFFDELKKMGYKF